MQQIPFFKRSLDPLSYGGALRNRRSGRRLRPLSGKEPLHLVFKIEKRNLWPRSLRSPRCFELTAKIIRKYAKKFFVSVDQISIQHDHIHMCIRAPRRCRFQSFFRVVAGQIAQQFENQAWVTDTRRSIWKGRPFTRVVRGYGALGRLRNYIQLNEKEVTGHIPYRKERLRGLSAEEWRLLWIPSAKLPHQST